MTAHRWGTLVHRELAKLVPLALAGCAAAPEPISVPPPSPTRVEPPPVVAQDLTPPGLSPLSFALAAADPPRTRPLRRERHVLRFGTATLVHEEIQWGLQAPDCPLAGKTPCALLAVTTDDRHWPPASRAAEKWVAFSAGHSVAYAMRDAAFARVDTIDSHGAVTPWLSDTSATGSGIQIVETTRGAFLLANDDTGAFLAPVLEREGGRLVGPHVKLGFDSVDGRPNAQGARAIEAGGKRAAWGDVHPVALLDESGKEAGGWAIVWTQVIPPPFKHPAGKPFRRHERKSAKHDCSSGPISRTLSDPSVEKRVTIQVFDGAKATTETVVDHPEKLDLDARPLEVHAVPGGIAIDGVAYDTRGKRLKTPLPAFKPPEAPDLAASIPDEEEVTGLAFDRASGEGLALIRRGEEQSFGRRFDSRGAFVGEPFPLHDGIGARSAHDEPVHLARVGASWLAFDRTEQRVAWLTGERAGAVTPLGERGSVLGLFPLGDDKAALLTDESAKAVVRRIIDVRAGTIGAPENIKGMAHALTAFVRAKDGVPFLVESPTRRLVDALTGEYGDFPEEPGLPGLSAAYDVGGDLVIAWAGPKDVTLTWLSSGKAVQSANKVFPKYATYAGSHVPWGPVLPSGWVLPSSPGEPIETEAKSVRELCPYSVTVAPGRVVMACSEPTDPLVPNIRAGVRVLRFAQP